MMRDSDTRPFAAPDGAKRFAEKNLKRGIDLRSLPGSSVESAVRTISLLLALPPDINVPRMHLEGRRP